MQEIARGVWLFPIKPAPTLTLPPRPETGRQEMKEKSFPCWRGTKKPIMLSQTGRIIYVSVSSKGDALLLELSAGSAAGQRRRVLAVVSTGTSVSGNINGEH